MSAPAPGARKRLPGRTLSFLALEGLVLVEAIVFAAQSALEFLAAAGGDPTPLFVSTILFALVGTLLYTSVALRSRESTPYFATVVASLSGILVLAALGASDSTHWPGIVLGIVVILALALMRGRFQLRPGEFVKEEKLDPEVAAKISTKVRGVRCRECGDDDVWITNDKQLVCRNCGSTSA